MCGGWCASQRSLVRQLQFLHTTAEEGRRAHMLEQLRQMGARSQTVAAHCWAAKCAGDPPNLNDHCGCNEFESLKLRCVSRLPFQSRRRD
jgi:hypothetical protein